MKNKKIGVLMGGVSREREISLCSGKNVVEALQKLGRTEEAVNVLTTALPLLDEQGRRKLESFIQTQRGY